MCSRVCGIGPSLAATTRIAPSICAAPVIMFDVVRVPRAIDARNGDFSSRTHVRRLIVMPRAFFRRLVDLIERHELRRPRLRQHLAIAVVSVVLPWSICPIVPMLQCGFVRSNFAFAIVLPPRRSWTVRRYSPTALAKISSETICGTGA
jgi:hypothetical protein